RRTRCTRCPLSGYKRGILDKKDGVVHQRSSFRMVWGQGQRRPRGGTGFKGEQPSRVDTQGAGAIGCSYEAIPLYQQAGR
ncbi:unnamed protein product, partial [Ascophyllum nodosum]